MNKTHGTLFLGYRNGKLDNRLHYCWNNMINRCVKMTAPHSKYYGMKGIKLLLTREQLRELWFRDNAISMKKPSIDRIDSNGHYEFSNCQFIEQSENSRKTHKKNLQINVDL